MSEEWLEHLEGPDGQFVELLRRIPYDRHRQIEQGMFAAKSQLDANSVVFRALLWSANVRDTLTGEMTDNIDRAGAEVIDPWRERAVELYNEWYTAMMPGPKGSTPKRASKTPSGVKSG